MVARRFAALTPLIACAFAYPASASEPSKAPKTEHRALYLADFDLADLPKDGSHRVSKDQAATRKLKIPRGMDTRDFAWDPPLVELPVSGHGPVFLAGAIGAGRKGAPKLAHVMIDWDF